MLGLAGGVDHFLTLSLFSLILFTYVIGNVDILQCLYLQQPQRQFFDVIEGQTNPLHRRQYLDPLRNSVESTGKTVNAFYSEFFGAFDCRHGITQQT